MSEGGMLWAAIIVGVLAIAGISYLIVALENIRRWATGKGAPCEIQPQPLVVSPAVKYSTADECKARHTTLDQRVTRVEVRLDDIENKLVQSERRIIEAGEGRAKGIHRRINALLAGQNRILGKLNMPGISEDSESL